MKTSHPVFCPALTALLLVVFAASSQAGLVISFSDDNGAGFANTFTVQTGESTTIGVFLQQTSPDTILNDEGIVSWGFNLSRSPSDLGTLSSPAINSEFDFENHSVATAAGYELEYAQTTGAGVTGDSILLASFEFTSSADGTTGFTVEDRLIGAGPGNATWFTPSFTELDEQIFGTGATDTYQFSIQSISAVPESSCFALFGGLVGLVSLRRPRRHVSKRAAVG